MTAASAQPCRIILYEGRESDPLPAQQRYAITSALLERGHGVTLANGNGNVCGGDGIALVVIGQFRAALPAGALPTSDDTVVRVHDIRGLDPARVVERVEETLRSLRGPVKTPWKPWFPVIDYDRCTNCMQCLSFCLFDVYAVDPNERITVQNQEKCKTDCPACSRVCPEVAILFPKYGKGPINGDVVRESDVQREAMKVDVSALLGGDIYASLRARQSQARQRFSTERDESRALLERKRCLKKLQGDLDIPAEVLMSLPSAGDIQQRAERAKAKMQQRLARSRTVQDQKHAPSAQEWGI